MVGFICEKVTSLLLGVWEEGWAGWDEKTTFFVDYTTIRLNHFPTTSSAKV